MTADEYDPPACQHPGCDRGGSSCYCADDLLAEPPRVTEYLCAEHASAAGYCCGCGRFFGGVESFDFDPAGLCDDCHAELDEDEGDDCGEVDYDPYEEEYP